MIVRPNMKLCSFFLLTVALFQLSCQKELSCEDCTENNKPPICVAGPDQVTALPANSVLLDGSLSHDPDGRISKWQWTKISGPDSFDITYPGDSVTVVKSLTAGTYLFELKVTDNDKLSARDTVQIKVNNPSHPNHPPVANAGKDSTIILPASSFTLDGRGSTDLDNNIMSYSWSKISGPSLFNIIDANSAQTQVTDLEKGIYLFELKVTDSDGLFSKDTIQVSVIDSSTTSCGDVNRPHVNAQLIPCGTLSKERVAMTVASVGNKIFFAGGSLYGRHSSRVDIYDITTQSWSTAELSQGRSQISAIAAGNKIFFAGGEIGDGTLETKTVDIYDASTNTWSVAALSESGRNMAVAAAGNKVFFAGGEGGFSASSRLNRAESVDIYDLSSSTWSVAHLSEPRWIGISAVTVDNKVYFAGGMNGFGIGFATDKIDIYDILSDSWSTSTLYEGKTGFAAISDGDKIFWAGGETGSFQNGHLSCVVEIKDVNAGNSIAYLSNPGAYQSFLKDGKIVFFAGGNTFDIYDITRRNWSIGVLPAGIKLNLSYASISVNNTIYIGGISNQVWKLEF